jgi:cytosine/adenosine deaminase-related metal-dependent hydrolase
MSEPVVYLGGAVRDAQQVRCAPGAVAMAGGVVLAAGEPDQVRRQIGACRTVDRPDRLLLPGLVNAHTHLQMTTIGPRAYAGTFESWVVDAVERWRAIVARQGEDCAVADSMAAGRRACETAGVGRIGDVISWNESAFDRLRANGPAGVGFIELVGIGGEKLERAIDRLDRLRTIPVEAHGVTLGMEPHAPYSTGPRLYALAAEAAATRGVRLTTHLAEMTQELEFVANASGPFRQMIDRMGRWDDSFAAHYGDGLTPVQWLADRASGPCPSGGGRVGGDTVAARSQSASDAPRSKAPSPQPCPQGRGGQTPWLCAHCNYVSDDDITLIAERGWSVAYCPRASEYFQHTGHRYRDMLEAGVNVCLGTDSIICTGDLSILQEMRRLYQRDGADPATLLAMATISGMQALQYRANAATFTPGEQPGLIAVGYDPADPADALTQALVSRHEPTIEVLEPAG